MNHLPTDAEKQEFARACIILQTLMIDPRNDQSRKFFEEADRTYRMSPPHALLAMAAYAAGRFSQMQEALSRVVDSQGELDFPREMILARLATSSGVAVSESCVDLVEAVIAHRVKDEDLRALVEQHDGAAFLALAAVVLILGTQVVSMDPEIFDIQELLAQEGIATAQGFLDRGLPE